MNKEDKELLLKDLCARLPYGVIVNVNGNNEKVDEINPLEGIITCGFQSFDVNECEPYLRPMSSVTEEEKKNWLESIHYYNFEGEPCLTHIESYDWLNKNMFDYRGLIEKNLALDCTGLNIY